MVGVPGRSKACNTCRQRKIACTLERPRCSQCIKSKRVCTGYQRERIFVPLHGSAKEILKTSTQKPPSSTHATSSSVFRKKDDTILPLPYEQRKRPSAACCTEVQRPIVKDVSVRHAFRQQLLGHFIYSYIPDSMLVEQRPKQQQYASWLMMITELPDLTPALEASIVAMTTAKVGRMNDDPVLVKASLKSYTQGLWELQKALWDPNLMYSDETLAACMALWMYEVMECPAGTPRGWTNHFDGCKRLIELRGAEAHASALGHQLFLVYRTTAINQVIKSRQPSYLADPDWIQLPWKSRPKTLFDQLLDQIATLANLFVQGYEIEGLESSVLLPAIRGIIKRCWKIEAELRRIYDDLEGECRGPLYWPTFATEDNPADDATNGKVFPVAFQFPNLSLAFTCMVYWASLILVASVVSHMHELLGTLQTQSDAGDGQATVSCQFCSRDDGSHETCSCEDSLQAAPAPRFDTAQQLPPVELQVDVVSAARNICQSVEYCMQAEMKGLGATGTVIPLMAVLDSLPFFPQCARELAWAKAVFERVKHRGFRLMGHLDSK